VAGWADKLIALADELNSRDHEQAEVERIE
jgi:hypothetical protein